MAYTKQPLEIDELIAMLKSRGLTIADESAAKEQLAIISYFRLAGYLRPMEQDKATHTFKPGSTFENAVALYRFDSELRTLLFSAIQAIEIALRAKTIQHFARKHGAFWFMESSLCVSQPLFVANLSRLTAEVTRSKEDFIKEHFAKYSDNQLPPVWKTLELASFGTLSKILENFADNRLKKSIARDFSLPQHLYLESWIKSLCSLRNAVAHHARIWNRQFPVKPQLPKTLKRAWISDKNFDITKLYPILCTMAYLVNAIEPENLFVTDFKNLLKKYPNADTAAMGFPENWQDEPLWKQTTDKSNNIND